MIQLTSAMRDFVKGSDPGADLDTWPLENMRWTNPGFSFNDEIADLQFGDVRLIVTSPVNRAKHITASQLTAENYGAAPIKNENYGVVING